MGADAVPGSKDQWLAEFYAGNFSYLVRWLEAWFRLPTPVAEDIAQETFLILVRQIRHGKVIEKPKAYCFKVAMNHAIRVVRPKGRWQPQRSLEGEIEKVAVVSTHAHSRVEDPNDLPDPRSAVEEESILDNSEVEAEHSCVRRALSAHLRDLTESVKGRSNDPDAYRAAIVRVLEVVVSRTTEPLALFADDNNLLSSLLASLLPAWFDDPEVGGAKTRAMRVSRARSDIKSLYWRAVELGGPDNRSEVQ